MWCKYKVLSQLSISDAEAKDQDLYMLFRTLRIFFVAGGRLALIKPFAFPSQFSVVNKGLELHAMA